MKGQTVPTIYLRGRRVATLLPASWDLGQQIVWTDDIYRKGRAGKVGEQSGFLTIVRGLPSTGVRFQNVSTFTLPKGQITAQGIWDSDMSRITLAITGGTGRYDRIRGEIDVKLYPGNNPPATYTAKFRIAYRG
jgi:hypothetical protein